MATVGMVLFGIVGLGVFSLLLFSVWALVCNRKTSNLYDNLIDFIHKDIPSWKNIGVF